MPEGFFRSEAAVVSGKAAIQILAGEKKPFGRGTIAASLRKKTVWYPGYVSCSDKGNLKGFEIPVKLILHCPKTLAITCLSHKGRNSVQRKTFKAIPSCKQVCRFAIKEQANSRTGKPTIVVSKTPQVQFTQSNFFTNKTLSNLILFTILQNLQRRGTTSSIDGRRKKVSKRALITSCF